MLTVEVAIDGSVTPVEEITVSYSTALLTAPSQEYSNATADDFTDISGNLVFPANATDPKSFTVPIIADSLQEKNRGFCPEF